MKFTLKNIIFFSVFLLSLSSFFFYDEASAAEKDLDVLYEKAKSGKSDLSDSQMKNLLGNVEIELEKNKSFGINTLLNNSEPTVQTYTTAELVESNEDSQLYEIYAFSDITLDGPDLGTSKISPFGIWDDSMTDVTSSVKAYIKMNIEATYTNGASFLRMTSSSGELTILDNRVKSLTNRYVGFGNGGMGIDGTFVNTNYPEKLLSSNSFSQTFNNSFVNKDLEPVILTSLRCTISNSSSSWNFKMILRNNEKGATQ
ncbi:hypothetical protein QUF65_01835 [Lysinibacillus sphaericus]|uniref:hypothetical protein n=1 Tax=Lysinibacillus sphaericus TaxID=1421 RepID=UPI0025A1EF2B|nr:hypothetical protein [Lysinibacillus sphaericus]MDM5349627.1 hypothetical protein [Lysinibacillus sphaericus]